jgi:hypothetical protein
LASVGAVVDHNAKAVAETELRGETTSDNHQMTQSGSVRIFSCGQLFQTQNIR